MQRDLVTVLRFFEENAANLGLELRAGKDGLKRFIREPTVNRPGLALAGFTRYFASKRLQVIGSAESTFLKSLPTAERIKRYRSILAHKIPCLVYCRHLNPDPCLIAAADRAGIPVFTSPLITMNFINRATLALEMMFAPYGTEMGSMVDILGVGVIIRGESGIGKSECVLELIERGYSLVADDVTKVMLADNCEIIGTSPALTRNLMEVRGIGIIDVAAMFGVKSIRTKKRLDLVVTLKAWLEADDVDRLGLVQQYVKILGIDVPHVILPVRPGRNLARLVEVAAFQSKLRLIGCNAAQDLENRLLNQMTGQSKPTGAPGAPLKP